MPGLCAGRKVVERGLDRFDFKGFFGRGEVEVGLCGSEPAGSGEIWRVAGWSRMCWESESKASSSFSV